MSLRQILVVVLTAVLVVGCSDTRNPPLPEVADVPSPPAPPASPPPPPPPPPPPAVPPEDVSGTWYSRAVNNAVNCGIGEFIDAQALVITQNDADISLLASTGDTFTGTVNGDIVEWTGTVDERGGTTTITTLSVTVSGNTASGNADWSWTDGVDSCNGTIAISASRDAAVTESLRNSRPPGTVDVITITDGAAFILGETISDTDVDYFSIQVAADATLQVEVSHFDTQTTDLDVEILDENLNQVSLSSTADSFEKAEAALTAGQTYYIGVLPITLGGDATYIISIDVN